MKMKTHIKRLWKSAGTMIPTVLAMAVSVFAQDPVDFVETWTDPVTSWTNDSADVTMSQIDDGTNGYMNLQFADQDFPSLIDDIARVNLTTGTVMTNISFRFMAEDTEPSKAKVAFHSEVSGNTWLINLTISSSGDWVEMNVPVDFAQGWYMGPASAADQFDADLRSASWVGIYVRRYGDRDIQNYRVDDFRIQGRLDTDGDLLYDAEEEAYGTLIDDIDSDDDGYTDYEEIIAGSDPLDNADGPESVVTITSPTSSLTYSTGSSEVEIAGTVNSVVAITNVAFTSSRSISGTCVGTENWRYHGIPLYSGENVITVTAYDIMGRTFTDTITVTYNPTYPLLDEAILRAGMVITDMSVADNLSPGDTVDLQWSILSYVPLRSAIRMAMPSGVNVTLNAEQTGVEIGPWVIGDRYSHIYSYECSWTVPDDPGTCKVRFLGAQMDGYAYMNANIPGRTDVDWRPYGTDGKEVLRDITTNALAEVPAISSENVVTNPPWFESLEESILRAGGTVTGISIPDNLTPGSVVTCRWDVLSYVPIRSRLVVDLPTLSDHMAEAVLTGVEDGSWQISNYRAQVYSFEYLWTVPDDPGECKVRFVNAQSDGYAWVNGNIPGGVDFRPDGVAGKEVLRTIK